VQQMPSPAALRTMRPVNSPSRWRSSPSRPFGSGRTAAHFRGASPFGHLARQAGEADRDDSRRTYPVPKRSAGRCHPGERRPDERGQPVLTGCRMTGLARVPSLSGRPDDAPRGRARPGTVEPPPLDIQGGEVLPVPGRAPAAGVCGARRLPRLAAPVPCTRARPGPATAACPKPGQPLMRERAPHLMSPDPAPARHHHR
jgi:hypothetical protein